MTRPERVVHVVAAGEIGGAERMLLDLIGPGDSASGHVHSIALFTPNDALRALFRDRSIPIDDRGSVREGPLPFLASSLGSNDVRWLESILRRRRASIVHLHTFASQVLGTRSARRAGARIVRTEHSTRVYDDPTCWPFARWSLRYAEAVVFISDHVKRTALARARFLRSTVSVIHNGIDTTHFAPRPPLEAPRDDRVRFVALGRLDPRKGLDLALRAMTAVPRAELAIVGEGEARASLEDLARRLGIADRVRFQGYAADVRDAISRADVALSSAREEGLGLALLEAMAMARPVVAVPIGGILEIVQSGVTGWLSETRSAESLARAMNDAIHHPEERDRRGALARKVVTERFSVETMRRAYDAIYARTTT